MGKENWYVERKYGKIVIDSFYRGVCFRIGYFFKSEIQRTVQSQEATKFTFIFEIFIFELISGGGSWECTVPAGLFIILQPPRCLLPLNRLNLFCSRCTSVCVCVDKRSLCYYQPQLQPDIKRWRTSGWKEVSSIDMLISVTLVHWGLLRSDNRRMEGFAFRLTNVLLQCGERLKPLIRDRKRGLSRNACKLERSDECAHKFGLFNASSALKFFSLRVVLQNFTKCFIFI